MSQISLIDKLILRLDKFFSIRGRSEKELRDYFKIKNYKLKLKGKEPINGLVIDQLVEKLKKLNLLNDLEFTKAWVQSRSRKYGPQRIRQELFKKGIDKEIIEEVFRLQDTTNSEKVAENLLERKINRWKNLSEMALKKKAYDFLLRRGFEYGIVKSIIENVIRKR